MKTITIEITDEQWAILRSCLVDPAAWMKNIVADKLRRVVDRVYEETTEKIAKKRTLEEKVLELSIQYNIRARESDEDPQILKHEKKLEQ